MNALQIWWHNAFVRHWQDWRARREWIARGLDPARFPRQGKITRELLAWAEEQVRNELAEEPDRGRDG